MDKVIIPTIKMEMIDLKQYFFVYNNSLAFFSIHDQTDYPSYDNQDLYDIDNAPVADLNQCILTCANMTERNGIDKGPRCNGVSYVNGICWRKSGINEGSQPMTSDNAVSGIMHLLVLTSMSTTAV